MSFTLSDDGLVETNQEAEYYLDDSTFNRMLTDSEYYEEVKRVLSEGKIVERLGEMNKDGKYEDCSTSLNIGKMLEHVSLGYFKKVGV